MPPAFVGDRITVLVDQIHRVHQLAEDIQLDLVISAVTDAHRLRAAVAGQMRQLGFRQFLLAIDGIEDVEFHRFATAIAHPSAQPLHVVVGFIDKAQAHERVNGERGISDPRVAVIPIALAAGGFRQAEGGGGEDRTVATRGQQFQGEGGAIDDFPPAPAIVGFADPAAPVFEGALHAQLAGAFGKTRIVAAAEHERGGFIVLEGELRDGRLCIDLQGLI